MSDLRPVPFAPGVFACSDGRVFSARRRKWTELRQFSSSGYRKVAIFAGGKSVWLAVHTVVCTLFHGQRPSGTEVRHLDGDRANNCSSNLRWGTKKENAADRRLHGTAQIGEQNHLAKLSEPHVREIKRMLSDRETQTHIATVFGVDQTTISEIATCQTWSHVSGPDMSRRVTKRGETHVFAKLTEDDVRAMRRRRKSGESIASIAKDYGVTQTNVGYIVRMKTWCHVKDVA